MCCRSVVQHSTARTRFRRVFKEGRKLVVAATVTVAVAAADVADLLPKLESATGRFATLPDERTLLLCWTPSAPRSEQRRAWSKRASRSSWKPWWAYSARGVTPSSWRRSSFSSSRPRSLSSCRCARKSPSRAKATMRTRRAPPSSLHRPSPHLHPPQNNLNHTSHLSSAE